jgi:hypothetical protein
LSGMGWFYEFAIQFNGDQLESDPINL